MHCIGVLQVVRHIKIIKIDDHNSLECPFLFLHLVNSDSFLKTELKSQIQQSNSKSKSVSLYKITVFFVQFYF